MAKYGLTVKYIRKEIHDAGTSGIEVSKIAAKVARRVKTPAKRLLNNIDVEINRGVRKGEYERPTVNFTRLKNVAPLMLPTPSTRPTYAPVCRPISISEFLSEDRRRGLVGF